MSLRVNEFINSMNAKKVQRQIHPMHLMSLIIPKWLRELPRCMTNMDDSYVMINDHTYRVIDDRRVDFKVDVFDTVDFYAIRGNTHFVIISHAEICKYAEGKGDGKTVIAEIIVRKEDVVKHTHKKVLINA